MEAAAGRFRPMGYDNCPLLTNSAEAGISVGRGGTFPAAGFFILASYRVPTLAQYECGAASAAPSFPQTSHAEVEIGAGGTFPAACFSLLEGYQTSTSDNPRHEGGAASAAPFSPRKPAGSRLAHQNRVVDAAPARQVGRGRSRAACSQPVAGSGSVISAPCSSISRASRIRPRRSQRRQRISSRSSRSTRSPSVTTWRMRAHPPRHRSRKR